MEETLKIKLLSNTSHIPTRGSDGAAGYHLWSNNEASICIKPHETVKIGTGVAVQIPHGYFGAIFARSGLATKRLLRPGNCVGVVDEDYTGEVIVAVHNDSDEPQVVNPFERIAQLVILPYYAPDIEIVDDLDETERGAGGFGSTGEK